MATLAELKTRKAAYLQAEARILESQEYTIGDGVANRRNRRADLADVRAQIAELDQLIDNHPDTLSTQRPRRVVYIR